jgi:hypothetical protein
VIESSPRRPTIHYCSPAPRSSPSGREGAARAPSAAMRRMRAASRCGHRHRA